MSCKQRIILLVCGISIIKGQKCRILQKILVFYHTLLMWPLIKNDILVTLSHGVIWVGMNLCTTWGHWRWSKQGQSQARLLWGFFVQLGFLYLYSWWFQSLPEHLYQRLAHCHCEYFFSLYQTSVFHIPASLRCHFTGQFWQYSSPIFIH